MNRTEKEEVIGKLHEKMAKAKTAILAEPKGLDVATVTELRKKCREAQVDYKIVKNTLAQRAAKGKPAKPMTRGTKMRSRKMIDRAISELADLREDKSCALALYVLMYVRGSNAALRNMPEQLKAALRAIAPKRSNKKETAE